MADEQPIERVQGEVIKLDRGYPLVKLEDGSLIRCEHATALVKERSNRAVIGDLVGIAIPEGHDKAVIESIEPRWRTFVRKDPTDRALPQVLAANFDRVIVAQPLSEVNLRRLERELVLAYETQAEVMIVLTKADLAETDQQIAETLTKIRQLAGEDTRIFVVSDTDPQSVNELREVLSTAASDRGDVHNPTTILIGRSGVGKSSLVNLLMEKEVQETGKVRESDGKGRHTTVSREIIELPSGGRVVDMPGVRGLGLWDADEGIDAAFTDIMEIAQGCRFRDCKHEQEPGSAVRAAVESRGISQERFDSYRSLRKETEDIKERREQAAWMQKERPSHSGRGSSQTKPRTKSGGHGKRR